jgi:hypothetical protein
MTEYRIVEHNRRFHIQELIKKGPFNSSESWLDLPDIPHVPRFFDSLADARSWVATIKKGVVYHDAEETEADRLDNIAIDSTKLFHQWAERYDAEDAPSDAVSDAVKDAPNLPVDERKAEDDTSDGIKPLKWFIERIGKEVYRKGGVTQDECATIVILSHRVAVACFRFQSKYGFQYSDPL